MLSKFKNMNVDDVVLGKELTIGRRILAYVSILVIYFFYCYNFYILSLLGPLMKNWGINTTNFGILFSVMSFGTLGGTILAGIIASNTSKKKTLIGLALAFAVSSFFHIFTYESFTAWFILRLISGVALGGIFGTAVGLIVDLFPQKYRGRLTSFASSLFAVAGILAGEIAVAFIDTNWTVLIWVAVLPTFIGILMVIFFVPDDGKTIRAQKQLADGSVQISKPTYRELLMSHTWIALGALALSGMNFSGYSGFSQFVPIYLQDGLGLAASDWGRMISIQNLGHFIGFNMWGFVADNFGRKKNIWGMVLCAAIIPVYMALKVDVGLAIFFTCAFLFGIGLGYSGVWGAYYSELFPEKFRTIAAGFCFNMGRIISMIAVPIIGFLGAKLGFKAALTIPAAFFLLGIIVWAFLPETFKKKKKTL